MSPLISLLSLLATSAIYVVSAVPAVTVASIDHSSSTATSPAADALDAADIDFTDFPAATNSTTASFSSADVQSDDPARFPRPLSNLAASIYSSVMRNARAFPEYTPVPVDLIGTSAHLVGKPLVDYDDTPIFADKVFYPAIANAEYEVIISTMTFDKASPTAQRVADAIRALNLRAAHLKRRIRVYMATDSIAETFFQHHAPNPDSVLHRHADVDPAHFEILPSADEVPHLDFRLRSFHRGLMGTMHSKMILVDWRRAILGSKNIEVNHAVEMMFELEGAVVRSLRADFQHIWGDDDPLPSIPDDVVMAPRRDLDVPVLALGTVERATSLAAIFKYRAHVSPQNTAWIAALANARRSVYIQTPNFSTKKIVSAVLAAVNRGVNVTIVTSFKHGDMNQRFFSIGGYGSNQDTAGYMFHQLNEQKKGPIGKLRVCWFLGNRVESEQGPSAKEWSHIKAMVVDDAVSILGSGNQDPQSWYRSREINVLIDDIPTTETIYSALKQGQTSLSRCTHAA